jgi:proteasome regulatory subunit
VQILADDTGDVKSQPLKELKTPEEKVNVKSLEDRIIYLEETNRQLQEEMRRTEGEKRFIESELIRLQKEVKRLKIELERLKSPPLIVGNVRDVLEDGRVVVKSSTGPDFIVYAADFLQKKDMKPGSRVALNKQTLSIMSVLPPSLDPIVTGAEVIDKPLTSYEEIGGLRDQLRELREAVEEPLLHPDLFRKVGIDPPKGVLLMGPPGTGKTLMAKAVAKHTNATFIRFVGSELVQKYIGEGARLVRELFELARERAPTIVFIDELDAIGAKRLEVATSGDREVQRTLMQLLAELDGFNPLENVRIIGATNRPDILDEALLRPGRFDRIIEIPMPTAEDRFAIFKIHMKRMNCDTNIDFNDLSNACNDTTTGADIKAICMEAGMFAIRERRDTVSRSDFKKATEKVLGKKPGAQSEVKGMFA